jgi:hypothetical protein
VSGHSINEYLEVLNDLKAGSWEAGSLEMKNGYRENPRRDKRNLLFNQHVVKGRNNDSCFHLEISIYNCLLLLENSSSLAVQISKGLYTVPVNQVILTFHNMCFALSRRGLSSSLVELALSPCHSSNRY